MLLKEIKDVLNTLPVNKYLSPAFLKKIQNELNKLSKYLNKNLNKSVIIDNGGTHPTTQKEYFRFYFEWKGNKTRNENNRDYNVISLWEYQSKSKYGYSWLGYKNIVSFCDWAVCVCDEVKGKKNPIK